MVGLFFIYPSASWGTVPRWPPASLNLRAPCENPGLLGSHDARAWEPPRPLFDVGCAVSSESVRTSSCPGQETAAHRPPGRGAGLHSLLRPLEALSGKGSEESFRP